MSLLFGFTSGIVSLCLWLAEILLVKKWHGLGWLDGYMSSLFVIIPLVCLTYMIPMVYRQKIYFPKIVACFICICLLAFASFELARSFFYAIYDKLYFLVLADSSLHYKNLMTGVLLPLLLTGTGFYLAVNYLLFKISKWTMLLIIGAVILSVFLGLLTIQVIPGFGSGTNFADAVKMGYPVFWISLLFSISGWFTKEILSANASGTK